MRKTPAASSSPPRLTFRPDIEGLRALAVALVVVLHAGVTAVSGGYIGVDVFFVISGFLITSLLIDEVRATQRVSILGFYARRARRILPAACFVIAATVVAAYLRLGPLVGRTTSIDGRWAAGFAANFRFIQQGTDYFASDLPPSPLQHYWSLAVEEQFYLVWPTLLFGLVLLGRRFARSTLTLQIGLVAIVGGSLYWSVHQSATAPTTAYFSPLTRAWELGAGALVAVFTVAISKTPGALRALATWVGLGLIVLAAFTLTAATQFPGYAALLPVVGTVLIVAGGIGGPSGGTGLVLGIAPMRWIGKISFSVYLWHWPVLIIAEERSATPLSNTARVACVAITLALSVASYYAIENPLRSTSLLKAVKARTDWERSRKALLVGAAAIMVAVTVSAYTNRRAVQVINGTTTRANGVASTLQTTPSLSPAQQIVDLERQVRSLVQQGLSLHTVPPDVDPPVLQISTAFIPKFKSCLLPRDVVAVKACIFGAVKARQTLVVFGDSHAMEWMPPIDEYGRRAGYRVVAIYKSSCPVPSVDTYVGQLDFGPTQAITGPFRQCTQWRNSALRYIRALKPTAVIIAFQQSVRAETRAFDPKWWISGLKTSVRALEASGALVIEIGDNATLSQDPGLCLSRRNADPNDCVVTFPHPDRAGLEAPVLESLGATFIDIEPWFCIDLHCPVIIDNRIAYANRGHVSAQYLSALYPLVAAELHAAGLR